MKDLKKLNVKKTKSKGTATQKARVSLNTTGGKAVVGCPELHYRK